MATGPRGRSGAAAGPAVAAEWLRRPVGQGRWRGQEIGSGEVVVDGSGGGELLTVNSCIKVRL
jgi:hypothetical protein